MIYLLTLIITWLLFMFIGAFAEVLFGAPRYLTEIFGVIGFYVGLVLASKAANSVERAIEKRKRGQSGKETRD